MSNNDTMTRYIFTAYGRALINGAIAKHAKSQARGLSRAQLKVWGSYHSKTERYVHFKVKYGYYPGDMGGYDNYENTMRKNAPKTQYLGETHEQEIERSSKHYGKICPTCGKRKSLSYFMFGPESVVNDECSSCAGYCHSCGTVKTYNHKQPEGQAPNWHINKQGNKRYHSICADCKRKNRRTLYQKMKAAAVAVGD